MQKSPQDQEELPKHPISTPSSRYLQTSLLVFTDIVIVTPNVFHEVLITSISSYIDRSGGRYCSGRIEVLPICHKHCYCYDLL